MTKLATISKILFWLCNESLKWIGQYIYIKTVNIDFALFVKYISVKKLFEQTESLHKLYSYNNSYNSYNSNAIPINISIYEACINLLMETRNSSKKQPLDFEKKWQLNSEKCSAKFQWTHKQLSPLR